MTGTEKEIQDFAIVVRQLLAKYKNMQEELATIKHDLEAQKKEAKEMELLATAAMRDYDSLKMAKMMEVSDGDIEVTRKRINKLIRDVNTCITLLSSEEA